MSLLPAPPKCALDGRRQPLAPDGHRIAVGVDHRRPVFHDADVTFPEHQVATLQVAAVDFGADRLFLHVGVA